MKHKYLKYKLVHFFILIMPCNTLAYQSLLPHEHLQKQSDNVNYTKVEVKKNWSVKKGQSLYGILSDWAMSNGWEVVWESKNNYVVNASAEFKNMSIDDAIKNLLVSMGDVQSKIFVRIFDGNRVILVKSDSGI
ncbi:TcpQ domain-containing protein [Escherichia coli]|uniref:TcpQ domain-containing protein n=1 Tax=Escherichia coli TaxID=562 RepID=UPI0012FFA49A|nr:TcpQ domain-containing protein [Escherichia coli]